MALTKNEIKYYSSLNLKKFRNIEQIFIAEGKRLVEDGLKSKFVCNIVLVSRQFEENNRGYLKKLDTSNYELEIISDKDFLKIADTKSPQGILAIFEMPKKLLKIKDDSRIVGLENISDPGNLGAILRTCDWFGIENVILSPECAEIYNPKVLRSSMGAIFHLNVFQSKDFYSELNELKSIDRKIIVADLNGINLFEYRSNKNDVIIFCNEANGSTDKLKSMLDEKVTIPKIGKGESLNVANAAAIIIAQITR